MLQAACLRRQQHVLQSMKGGWQWMGIISELCQCSPLPGMACKQLPAWLALRLSSS